MKTILPILFILFFIGCSNGTQFKTNKGENISLYTEEKEIIKPSADNIKYMESHYLVQSARKQIGVVTKYDTGYYSGGYPPSGQGACTDVIEQALRDNGYNLKMEIDNDMKNNPERYYDDFDSNINFRRVRNVKIFLDHHAEKISTCITAECFNDGLWQAGDVVTYDQIPGGLWHIAIVSDKTEFSPNLQTFTPYLIHNYGRGVVEDDMLLNWPATITGHYRMQLK